MSEEKIQITAYLKTYCGWSEGVRAIMRNILDDFSYEFGYINNEDVYDRVFSNFCIGK